MSINKVFDKSYKNLVFKQLSSKITITENKDIDQIKIEVSSKEYEDKIHFETENNTITIRLKDDKSGNGNVFNNIMGNIVINSQVIFGKKSDIIINIEIPSDSITYIENKSVSDITLRNIEKEITIKQTGQGDIDIKGTKNVNISSSGQGDIDIRDADNVTVTISGQGDIDVSSSSKINAVTARISGMGDIRINADVESLDIRSSGMGDVKVKGNITNKNVKHSGMGDVKYID